jgi:maltose O-acetyltransferase
MILKSLIKKIFFRIITSEMILNEISNNKVKKCLTQTIIGPNTRYYEEAIVNNFQNDKSKITIGENTHIRAELTIWPYGNGIRIGNNSYLGKGTVIRSGDQITIGNSVLIAHNTTIIDSDSHEMDSEERDLAFKEMILNGHSRLKGNVKTAPIHIEDNCWISYNVSILKGVRIGKGSIIGAGSVVTKDIPEFSIVVGNPAKVIKNSKFN